VNSGKSITGTQWQKGKEERVLSMLEGTEKRYNCGFLEEKIALASKRDK